MIPYVTGYMFNAQGRVLMIRKNRPAWQAGKLNGVGGKIEHKEWPHEAMVREFWEETGLTTTTADWHLKIQLVGRDFELNIFTAQGEFDQAFDKTDEKLVVVDLANPPYAEMVPTSSWILPMVQDKRLMAPALLKYRGRDGLEV